MGAFQISTAFDNVFADIEGGVAVIGGEAFSIKLDYQGRFGEHTEIHSGALKLGVKF